jgi:hypothetical protein
MTANLQGLAEEISLGADAGHDQIRIRFERGSFVCAKLLTLHG